MSPDEIKYLLQRAQESADTQNFLQALNYYNILIDNDKAEPEYFRRRAYVHEMMDNINLAINDINRAIELEPDNNDYYWIRGVFFSYKLTIESCSEDKKNLKLLNSIICDYKASLERNPTDPVPWLNLIEYHILTYNFYDAVSLYGASKPYITSSKFKKIRAYLGCIALILADEEIENEDIEPLEDHSVKLNNKLWRSLELNKFLEEIGLKMNFNQKWRSVKKIHDQFMDDFEGESDELIRYLC